MIDHALDHALEGVAAAEVLLVASDYDGVLSPIVADPARAIPHPAGLAAFVSVSTHPRVRSVLISGRSTETLGSFVGSPAGIRLVGNHGAGVHRSIDEKGEFTVPAITDGFAGVAERFPGTEVEPKSLGAAFHYRNAADPVGAAEAALAVASRFDARTIHGKQVVEVVVGHGTKGTAVEAIRTETGADAAIYFGDDVTDEDVFRTLTDPDVGVKVGNGDTAAAFRVRGPDEVAEALTVLDGYLTQVR
jgi:trehalose 6-phosphate phosphatase